MSDVRRRAVRLSIFLLPALLILAALHYFRDDLRDSASSLMTPRYTFHDMTFVMRGRARAEQLAGWLRREITELRNNDRIYGFKEPAGGFRIEVRSEQRPSESFVGSNRILIGGIPDDAPWEVIQTPLSRLVARVMLREGALDADFSPWFEEGVSRFYEGARMIGSRKDDLIFSASQNHPRTLAEALDSRGGAHFEAVSHALIVFLHVAYGPDLRTRYAQIERSPGSVPLGEFERIFGQDVERRWLDFIERR
jgi:hypothetical protein